MPDMKYASQSIAREYSKIPHYPEVNQAGVKEMYRQVGDLHINEQGLATRGLVDRHLLLPDRLTGTEKFLPFLADEISLSTYINLMDQYRPVYNVRTMPDRFAKINRTITKQEYRAAAEMAGSLGLYCLDR